MATNKKGQFAKPREYAKHLRKWGNKMFWKTERALAKEDLQKQIKTEEKP